MVILRTLVAASLMVAGLAISKVPAVNAEHNEGHEAVDDCPDLYRDAGKPTYPEPLVTVIEKCWQGYEGDEIAFMYGFNTETLVPDWVIERVTEEKLKGPAKRKNKFRQDPALKQEVESDQDTESEQEVESDQGPKYKYYPQAEKSDYKNSGFDRGHQAPAADFKWDQDAMNDTFYFTNMAPQVGIGFNRGPWAALEKQVRCWVKSRGEMIVITGPVYEGVIKTIGDNKVAVPPKFYKIIYDPKRKRAIAFLLPNRKLPKNDSYKEFITSVRDVENRTGLDFLTELSRRKQNIIETGTATLWSLRGSC